MLPPTRRLDHGDPLLLEFEARVLDAGLHDGRPAVVLDASAFYPESGGQLADLGSLGDAIVTDVQVDNGGVVRHYLAEGAALPAPGASLAGRVDRPRRRLHMALHTGQHMLSRALLDEAGGETVSSRLGSSSCTIDLHLAAVVEAAVARAEALVNAVIDDDRAVRVFFPAPDELAALPLRRAPKVTENIRVVDVGGFDLSPCGGTHCARTSLVGALHITGVERFRGKTRVTFLAGRAALDELRARSASLAELGRLFTCGPHDARAAIERLRAELQSTRDALGDVRARWAEGVAERLLREAAGAGSSRVVLALDGESVETLRALGQRIAARPGAVAFLASRVDDGLLVLVARGEASSFDCGAWLKRAAAAQQGRGGGRPERAEGRLPGGVDWSALVAATAD